MKISKHWNYDYSNKCDCADDDNCGCSYPENMLRTFTKSEEYEPEKSAQTPRDENK